MKRIILISALFSIFISLQVSVSVADTIWATNVVSTSVGTGFIDKSRSNTDNALGAPDDMFYSPGIGGWAIFEFGNLFDVRGVVVETTYGNRAVYPESADVLVSSTNVDLNSFQKVASISNILASTTIDLSSLNGPFKYLMILDTTQIGGDGFDVNAVGVNPVPEPATVLLFGVGLVGLLSSSIWKKKNSNKNI